MSRAFAVVLGTAVSLSGFVCHLSAEDIVPKGTPIAVSTGRPTDSRGETVYERAKTGQANPVAGEFHSPVLVQVPHISANTVTALTGGSIVISLEGVIAENGEFIDVTVSSNGSDPELAKRVAQAYVESKYKPATLNGKPVAFLYRTTINFHFGRDQWHR